MLCTRPSTKEEYIPSLKELLKVTAFPNSLERHCAQWQQSRILPAALGLPRKPAAHGTPS